ncbi:Tat proofreading chaperone DmsD [Pasteurellaceae bacterium Pebbles2]|nr:Tat proofreading chaperone DmsD [Pasteurellaceae bacterium Pebbles2]
MDKTVLQSIAVSAKILGALFYYAPDDEKVRSILAFFQQENWQNQWFFEPNENTLTLINQGLQQNLAEQYQALFIGPNALAAPPWGSVYLDPENVIFGNSLLAFRAFLQQHHIDFTVQQDEPEDHIGLMLMLTAYLAENQPDLLPDYLRQHFLPWAFRYLTLLSEQNVPFYQGLAQLTQETLHDWQVAFAIEPVQQKLYF